MKIVVLTGSPRRNGNTNHLAGQFIKGAEEAGHEVYHFDCAQHKVSSCIACNRCGMNGQCIFNDDFGQLLSAPCDRRYGGIRHANVLLRILFAAQSRDRPLLCAQRAGQGKRETVGLADGIR